MGDTVTDGVHTVDHLIEAAAYAQWHRRLFARFLAERSLLRHPDHGVAVTLDEAEELAAEEGFVDGWSAAESYAARMLPAVFQPEDPVLSLTLAPEHALALRKLVLGIDAETFQAEDSLGWTYQFWRALEKERVNKAGEKIGARDLPAVTQLFTEPYMVKFLLHNTLGAWRAGRVLAERPELAATAANESALRTAVSPPGYEFDMLRFVREGEDGPWRPAAGTFPGWPQTSAEIRALDPCCGSGHFLTEMLAILGALRGDEEGLTNSQAVAAVLSDNLFGLELDGRCVQIAAFAVALTAWRIGGFQPFGSDQVHVAWVGAPPPLDRNEFVSMANGDDELRQGLAGLHDLFVRAPLLGSLIDPTGGDLTRMFGRPITDQREMLQAVATYVARAAEKLRQHGLVSADMTVFFHTGAHAPGPPRSVSGRAGLWAATSDTVEMVRAASAVVCRLWAPGFRYTKAGVMLDDLVRPDAAPRNLLDVPDPRRADLMKALDRVNGRFGRGALAPASAGLTKAWSKRADMLSPAYTTRLSETPTARA